MSWRKIRGYETRWKAQLQKLPDTERDEMLFMLAARWADDIRTRDPSESHPQWHYIDFPFKPDGVPPSIKAVQPPRENILTAIAENTPIALTEIDPTQRAIALAWLFHLYADVNQPLMMSNSSRGNTRTGIVVAVISAFACSGSSLVIAASSLG